MRIRRAVGSKWYPGFGWRTLAALSVVAIVSAGAATVALGHGKARHHTPSGYRVFDVVYRGSGEFDYESRESDNAGCSRLINGEGGFSFDQEWHLRAKARGSSVKFTSIDHLRGPGPLGGGAGENHVHLHGEVQSYEPPDVVCQHRGSFDCTGANLIPQSLPGVDLLIAERGRRLTFLPQGFYQYKGALTGSDTVDIPDGNTCDTFKPNLPTPYSGFAPTDDAWGKIPVRSATLANLKPGHYFKVGVNLGHYTVGTTRSNCLGVEDHDPHDYCTVDRDQFEGTFSVRRVR